MRRFNTKSMHVTVLVVGAAFVLTLGFWGCSSSTTGSSGLPSGSATRAQVLHGRYLAVTMGCADCHSAGKDPSDPMWLAGFVDGTPGQPFMVGAFKVYPSNLTPDNATGLGTWTPQNLFDLMRTGKDPQGQYVCPPMPYPAFRNLTDDDTWAIAAYLRSIKAVSNTVPVSEGPGAAPGHHPGADRLGRGSAGSGTRLGSTQPCQA